MSATTDLTMDALTANVELSETERHELLAHDRRRIALDVLSAQTEPITLSELAAAISTYEGSAGPDLKKEVRVALHHVHLPMMEDLGIVGYDPDAKRIDPLNLDVA